MLRGLLYVYEVTGEDRFMQRAEAVYEIIARGQNGDGSWNKRFQVLQRINYPTKRPTAWPQKAQRSPWKWAQPHRLPTKSLVR